MVSIKIMVITLKQLMNRILNSNSVQLMTVSEFDGFWFLIGFIHLVNEIENSSQYMNWILTIECMMTVVYKIIDQWCLIWTTSFVLCPLHIEPTQVKSNNLLLKWNLSWNLQSLFHSYNTIKTLCSWRPINLFSMEDFKYFPLPCCIN